MFPIDDFASDSIWLVDRMWSDEERLDFGWIDLYPMVNHKTLAEQFTDLSQLITQVIERFGEPTYDGGEFRDLSLSNENFFRLTNGIRYVANQYGTPGVGVPAYSANPNDVKWIPEVGLKILITHQFCIRWMEEQMHFSL